MPSVGALSTRRVRGKLTPARSSGTDCAPRRQTAGRLISPGRVQSQPVALEIPTIGTLTVRPGIVIVRGGIVTTGSEGVLATVGTVTVVSGTLIVVPGIVIVVPAIVIVVVVVGRLGIANGSVADDGVGMGIESGA